jgi:hypothetical protein
MEILHSNLRPVREQVSNFHDKFAEYASRSDYIQITSGYISEKSILFLNENIEEGRLPSIDLSIGMHYYEGFTRSQYSALTLLADTMWNRFGCRPKVCSSFKFHGKLYSFHKSDLPFATIMGSSNLSALSSEANFEVDIAIDNGDVVKQLSCLQKDISDKATLNIPDWCPDDFLIVRPAVSELPEVVTVTSDYVADLYSKKTGLKFDLPLKPEKKSNLNVYFGRGRVAPTRGLIKPRPWYEVEIIVGTSITNRDGYPRHQEFDVVTDDGYKFRCHTGVDNTSTPKNFRSKEGGLGILGAWIKGRLESAGAIKVGQFITKDDLDQYGKDHIELIQTEEENIWILDFNPS